MRRLTAATAALLCAAGVAAAQRAARQGGVRAVEPPWVLAGSAARVRLIGPDLPAGSILFEEPGLRARILETAPYAGKTDAEKARGNTAVAVEVLCAADLRPGNYPFRLEAPGKEPADGRLYVDTPAPEVAEREPNDDLRKPQELPPGPVTVLGKLDGDGVDVFRFTGRAGEVWRVEVFARRLGPANWEPVLRLRGARLVPLRVAIDRGEDCFIEYRLPADGAYLVELFDADNRKDPASAYRLHLRRVTPAG